MKKQACKTDRDGDFEFNFTIMHLVDIFLACIIFF